MTHLFSIFDVPFENIRKEDVLARVDAALSREQFFRVATVNPEFLLKAERDPAFHENLLSADLRVVDGFGVVLVGWLRGKCLTRLPGADLLRYVLAKAERDGAGVFLAIRSDGLSSYEEIRQALLKQYPRLMISGQRFTMDDFRLSNSSYQEAYSEIKNLKSKILLCNFGAPEQEFFVESFRKDPGTIRLAMGVGGSFDFLTGKRKRAPGWMRAFGLEWLWRLFIQPERDRLSRIWNATAVFLWKALTKN